jgi:hypothetical protein
LYYLPRELHKDREHQERQRVSEQQGFAVDGSVVDLEIFFEVVEQRVFECALVFPVADILTPLSDETGQTGQLGSKVFARAQVPQGPTTAAGVFTQPGALRRPLNPPKTPAGIDPLPMA